MNLKCKHKLQGGEEDEDDDDDEKCFVRMVESVILFVDSIDYGKRRL